MFDSPLPRSRTSTLLFRYPDDDREHPGEEEQEEEEEQSTSSESSNFEYSGRFHISATPLWRSFAGNK